MASGHRGSVLDSVQRLYAEGSASTLDEAQLLERFLARGDQAAFEAILRRHGPLVIGVCRRVLDDPHDVEDAFQATFLVLVKKAGSIRDRDVLAAWLYGVARRVAVRAKVNARRRRAREQGGAEGAIVDVEDRRADGAGIEELRSLIDDELDRLPERYRTPLILCDLEGQTHEQAAEQLRCPVGTVKSRLSRGRERLRSRLARRGVAPSAALLATALATEAASAVPVELLERTARAATRLAGGGAIAAGAFSAEVAALTKGVTRSMSLSKFLPAATATLALAVTVAGAWALAPKAPAPPTTTGGTSPPQQKAARAGEGFNTPAEPNVERFRLDNGLKVFLRPVAGAQQAALVVLYNIGQDNDPKGLSGLSHLVEHVYLTAAAGDEKARSVEQLMRRYPNGANGQTGDRYTMFATTFPAQDLDAELRSAAARMGDLRPVAADLERERPRLLAELGNMYRDFPALAAQNNARDLIRPGPFTVPNVRYVRVALIEQGRAITLDQVLDHWRRHYKPRNAIVSLAGAFDPKAARKAIEAYFAKLPAGEPLPVVPELGAPKFGAVREYLTDSPAEPGGPYASLAYAAPAPDSELYAPFLVLIARLWANSSKLGNQPFPPPVYFTPMDDGAIVAVTAPAQPGEPSAKAIARLEAFVAETIAPKFNDGERNMVRQQVGPFLGIGTVPDVMLANYPYTPAFSIGRREQWGLDPAKLAKALAAVTDADVRRAADEVFSPKRHAAVLMKPGK